MTKASCGKNKRDKRQKSSESKGHRPWNEATVLGKQREELAETKGFLLFFFFFYHNIAAVINVSRYARKKTKQNTTGCWCINMATATAAIEPCWCASPPGNFKAKESGVLSNPGNTSSSGVLGFEVKLFGVKLLQPLNVKVSHGHLIRCLQGFYKTSTEWHEP